MTTQVSDMRSSSASVDQGRNELYPVFLKMDEFETLLVGGGNVALEKLRSLLSNSPNASITVVAPLIREELKDFSSTYPGCKLITREFEEADLVNKRLVICATNNQELHRSIKLLCKQKGILLNVADTPELCDFYLGSIVQKKNLKIAISTNGKSPTIAKRMKEVISDLIPDEMEEVLNNLQTIRNEMKEDFQEKVRRLNEITKELAKRKYEG